MHHADEIRKLLFEYACLCVRSSGPSDEIGRGQVDLLFTLLGKVQLLHVIVPPGQVKVPLLVQVRQVFLKDSPSRD